MANHKRIHRLYRLEGMQLRMRVRRCKHTAFHRGLVPTAKRRYERLKMDFVHDQLLDERCFRIVTVVDQQSSESVIVEPRMRHRGLDGAQVPRQWVTRAGAPSTITVDHGSEFTSKALE